MENGDDWSFQTDAVEPEASTPSSQAILHLPTRSSSRPNTGHYGADTRFNKISDIKDLRFINLNVDNYNKINNETANGADVCDNTSLSSSSPEVHDMRDRERSHDHSIYGNEIRSNGIGSSTDSYTERLLRSGVWPLAEGSVLVSTFNNDVSIDSAPVIRTGLNKSDATQVSRDENADQKEEKGFSLKTLTREQTIILIAISCTNLLSFLSLSILAPFFPLEAENKQVNSTISGWIFGVFALVQFLTSPFFGYLLPIVGCKFMYTSGLFMCGGCTLLFGVLDRVDTSDSIIVFVTLCFAVRILLAIACTGLNTAGFVLLVKYFPDSVATVFGIGEVFTGIGMVAGPAMGGFLYAAGGFILPFAVIGGCSFLAFPIVWYFIPQQDDTPAKEESNMSIKQLLLHPRTIVNNIVVTVAASVWSVLDPTLEPHLRVYGLGPEMVGVLFLIMAAFYSLTSPVWGRIADILPDNRIILAPGLLVCAIGLLLAGPSPVFGFGINFNELWLTITSLAILGIGCSMAVIPTYDVYIGILGEIGYPEDTRTYGMVSGLWMSMYALGDFIGPSLGGFLFDQIGFEWLVTCIGGACVLTSILVCVTWFAEKKCCRKPLHQVSVGVSVHDNHDVTEKTPLMTSVSNNDVLSTYSHGSNYASV